MAIRPIRTFGDPILRQRARPVGDVAELHGRLIDDMIETMRHAPGVGLAAPQVGVLERIFVWEVEEGRPGAVVDPVIVARSTETEEAEEGCLSIPGLYYPVWRPATVVLEGRGRDGAPLRVDADGLLARVFQHELDHLDGVLFIDRLAPDARRDALRVLADRALGLPERAQPERRSQEAI